MDKGARGSHHLSAAHLVPCFSAQLTACMGSLGPWSPECRWTNISRVNLGSSARQERIWASDHPVFTLPGAPRTFHPRALRLTMPPVQSLRGTRGKRAVAHSSSASGGWGFAHVRSRVTPPTSADLLPKVLALSLCHFYLPSRLDLSIQPLYYYFSGVIGGSGGRCPCSFFDD